MNAPVNRTNLLPENQKSAAPRGAWESPRKAHLKAQHQEVMREKIRAGGILQKFMANAERISRVRDPFELEKIKAQQQSYIALVDRVLPKVQAVEVSGSLTLDEVLHVVATRPRAPVPPPEGEVIEGEASEE